MADMPPTLGDKIDFLVTTKDRRKAFEDEAAKVKELEVEIEAAIIAQMESLGIDKTSVNGFSVARTASVVPQAEDWDVFYKYVKKTGYFHLLQRRLSAEACRELFGMKGAIPGVVPFTKVGLSLRKS